MVSCLQEQPQNKKTQHHQIYITTDYYLTFLIVTSKPRRSYATMEKEPETKFSASLLEASRKLEGHVSVDLDSPDGWIQLASVSWVKVRMYLF